MAYAGEAGPRSVGAWTGAARASPAVARVGRRPTVDYLSTTCRGLAKCIVPSPALDLSLFDQEFRLCLDYWLGVRMTEGPRPCPACGNPSAADPMGDHQVGCGGNGDRIHRHDVLRDVLFAASQSAALAPRKEVPSLIPGSVSRPADIFLPNWCGGRPPALDVTVISTMQPLTQAVAATEPSFALKIAEARKMAAHNADYRGIGATFLPIVVETLGGWSPDSISQIARIGRLAGQRLGTLPATTIKHLFQRLSIILWKGNATLWSSRLSLHSAWVRPWHKLLGIFWEIWVCLSNQEI